MRAMKGDVLGYPKLRIRHASLRVPAAPSHELGNKVEGYFASITM
jgi:hypothetical protein